MTKIDMRNGILAFASALVMMTSTSSLAQGKESCGGCESVSPTLQLAQLSPPAPLALPQQLLRRTDGATFDVSGGRAQAIQPRLAAQYSQTVSRLLRNDISTYSLSQIDAATTEAAISVFGPGSAALANIQVTICWNGRNNRWCVTIGAERL